MALIRIEEAVKRYGDTVALDRVSLRVEAGECLGLVGESGSGKTTLLRTINRLTELDGGRVLLDGRSVDTLNPVRLRRSIGYVQQDGGLIPHWTVGKNASLVPELLAAVTPPSAAGRVCLPWGWTRKSSVIGTLASCREASGSGWRSRVPSRQALTFCSWTSPSAPSTQSRATKPRRPSWHFASRRA